MSWRVSAGDTGHAHSQGVVTDENQRGWHTSLPAFGQEKSPAGAVLVSGGSVSGGGTWRVKPESCHQAVKG